jgi:translation initiation factor 3 subunit H
LKIIKHCRESYPNDVTGQLLGLDDQGTLEVTNCFPFPSDGDEDASGNSILLICAKNFFFTHCIF